MDAIMLHYYHFKNVYKNLPKFIKDNCEFVDDDLIFNFASFNDVPIFYRLLSIRKDKYKIYDKFNSKDFLSLLVECIINIHDNNDYKKLIFIYALYSHYLLDTYLDEYLKGLEINDKDDVYNIIDYMQTLNNDDYDITKKSLTKKYKKGFVYYKLFEEVLAIPMVQIFNFYPTKEYFNKCYHKKYIFYKFLNRSKTKIKVVFYKLFDLFLKNKKKNASSFLINKKMSINILMNKDKKEINFFNETIKYDFNDLLKRINDDTNKNIKIINDYLFNDKDKDIRKLFNINKDKKM